MIPISITGKAIEEIKKIREAKQIPSDYALRVGVRGTGCVGISFLMGFDHSKETDLTFNFEGMEVLIAKHHMMYLVGREVDFYQGTDAKGFVFNDPK